MKFALHVREDDVTDGLLYSSSGEGVRSLDDLHATSLIHMSQHFSTIESELA